MKPFVLVGTDTIINIASPAPLRRIICFGEAPSVQVRVFYEFTETEQQYDALYGNEALTFWEYMVSQAANTNSTTESTPEPQATLPTCQKCGAIITEEENSEREGLCYECWLPY